MENKQLEQLDQLVQNIIRLMLINAVNMEDLIVAVSNNLFLISIINLMDNLAVKMDIQQE